MLEYEPEKFSKGLMQGPKMAINLRPPSSNHWNIALDLILPLTVDTFRQWCEAKRVEQGLEGGSVGAEASPKEAPAPGKAPQVVVGGSRAAFPTETKHQGERALETTRKILEHIHAICLQTMHEMGGVRELEQTLVHTLMFARLQLILGEDLTKSLSALRSELETSSEALSSNLVSVLNLHSGIPLGEGTHRKAPAVCLHEGEPTPDGAWGSQRRPGGIPPEMSPRTELPIRVLGDDRGTLSDTIGPCQQVYEKPSRPRESTSQPCSSGLCWGWPWTSL